MSTNQADRPPRTRPRPAADAGVDPIDYKPTPVAADEGKPATTPVAAPAAAPAVAAHSHPGGAPAAAGGVEVTVQLSTRISPDVNDVLTQANQRTGKKKRALIEEAILRTWGNV